MGNCKDGWKECGKERRNRAHLQFPCYRMERVCLDYGITQDIQCSSFPSTHITSYPLSPSFPSLLSHFVFPALLSPPCSPISLASCMPSSPAQEMGMRPRIISTFYRMTKLLLRLLLYIPTQGGNCFDPTRNPSEKIESATENNRPRFLDTHFTP